jgi:Xaa-Pro aminopeptidase
MTHATSRAERARRRAALWEAADRYGWEALVISGRGDEFMRGRIQWVSDIFQWGGWGFLVLVRRGDVVFLADPLGGYETAEDIWVEDVRDVVNPGREIADVLAGYGVTGGLVGVVGLADIMAAAHLAQLEAVASRLEFDDATAVFDDVRAEKSDEELANLEETSAILRSVFVALEAEIRPGVREVDVLAEAHRLCRQFGCVEGIAMLGRPPARGFGPGSPEVISRDDVVVIDLEWGGPSGYWLELRRCFSFGPPPDAIRRFWEIRIETFEACLDAIVPGASSDDVLAARDAVLARHGLTAYGDTRYSAHGIGIDSLEPPWVPGNERRLRERMVLSLHPNVLLSPADSAVYGGVSIGDNVLVTGTRGRRMTYAEDEWIILDA